jgi:hypothetical protein
MPAEPSQRDSLYINHRRLNLAAQPTIQINKKPAIITPKKLRLNAKYIGSKTKKGRKRDSIGSP